MKYLCLWVNSAVVCNHTIKKTTNSQINIQRKADTGIFSDDFVLDYVLIRESRVGGLFRTNSWISMTECTCKCETVTQTWTWIPKAHTFFLFHFTLRRETAEEGTLFRCCRTFDEAQCAARRALRPTWKHGGGHKSHVESDWKRLEPTAAFFY